jgi:ATP-binding cassette subfamily F protein 3
LFEEVTFRLGAGDRVGLVGKKRSWKVNDTKKILARILLRLKTSAQEKFKWGFTSDIDFEQEKWTTKKHTKLYRY